MSGPGERPTGARVVRRRLLGRLDGGTVASRLRARIAARDPLHLQLGRFRPARTGRQPV